MAVWNPWRGCHRRGEGWHTVSVPKLSAAMAVIWENILIVHIVQMYTI